MTWGIVVTKPAQKDLQKIPLKDEERIKAVLIAMREDPFGGDIIRLKGHPSSWRRRVGNYRIFYDVYPERLLIVITGIVRRTSSTY